jgi:tetratricopeptide (TPR) repeat protein
MSVAARRSTRTLGGMAKSWIFLASLLVALNCSADDDLTRGEWIIYWNKGREANRKKDYDTAVRELSRGIELTKSLGSKDMFVDRGDAYFGQGNYELAIADYLRAVELSKRNAGEVMGRDYASRTRTFDLAPIYEKLSAAYAALARKSTEVK